MKIYKKIMKTFGGAGLYMDKTMLNHLGCVTGEEVVIELCEDGLMIRKPDIDPQRIQELINAQIKQRN